MTKLDIGYRKRCIKMLTSPIRNRPIPYHYLLLSFIFPQLEQVHHSRYISFPQKEHCHVVFTGGAGIDVAGDPVRFFEVPGLVVKSTTALERFVLLLFAIFVAISRLFFADRSIPHASQLRYDAGLWSVQISQAQTASTLGLGAGRSGLVATGTGGGLGSMLALRRGWSNTAPPPFPAGFAAVGGMYELPYFAFSSS
jgi:hypothetical protein